MALADALRRVDPQVGIVALGTEKGLETRLVPERGYSLALIPPVPLPRRPSRELLTLPARIKAAVDASAAVLAEREADVVVGFGGYVAFPAYLAARRAGVPIVVHEANAKPGLANRVGARMTTHVAVASPDIALPHAEYVGIPLRRAIAGLDRSAMRDQARAFFDLDPRRTTLLVFGGSQGARRLNEGVLASAGALADAGVQVLHAAGRDQQLPPLERPPGAPPYRLLPYVDRMDLAYAAADLAVSRAGAMTCAELAAVGLPSVYVPFPIGNGEQRFNALPVVRAGGGLLVDDAEFTPSFVSATVLDLLGEPDRLAVMAAAAAAFGRRDADDRLVRMVQRAVQERERRS